MALGMLGRIGLRFIATGFIIKFVLGSAAIFIVPRVVKYVMFKYGSELIDYALQVIGDFTGGTFSAQIIEITGFAAYLFDKLRVVDCFSVLMSAYVAMFFLSFVRR
jgi:hypothetical protein